MEIKNIITTTNSKLGGSIAQVNMPYAVSCREDAPCFKECYCTHGNMAFSNVRNSHMARYEMYKEDPETFFQMINHELKMIPYQFFRWHSSGDIVDTKYLELMFKLARQNPKTKFLCFTKKYELVNNYLNTHTKPSNIVICLSNWGDFVAENPHRLPTSWVEFGDERDKNIPRKAVVCRGNCGTCDGNFCWNLKKGMSVKFKKH